MLHLYRAVCMDGEGVAAEIRLKVAPYIGRRYFSLQPPGSEYRMMYAPQTQLREHWARTDLTKNLVLFVPGNAHVRVTSADLTRELDEAYDFEKVDLRRDLILLNHDVNGHPKPGPTLTALRGMGFWPTMADGKDSVQAHYGMCAHCLAEMQRNKHHGVGIETLGRGEVLQLDHKINTKEEALSSALQTLLE